MEIAKKKTGKDPPKTERKIIETPVSIPDYKRENFSKYIRVSDRFAALSKLITRDLNNGAANKAPTFSRATKDSIVQYLENPYTYEKQLRAAVTYIYGASSHFRRLIQYFVGLTDLSYVVSPYRIDPSKANARSINRNYRKTMDAMAIMSVKSQFPKILTTCLREDVFYGTMWVTKDSITIQQLPSDYCKITSIEGNVLNVTFDFSYFDSNSAYLPFYTQEFETKYNAYKKDTKLRYQELDSPTSFAVKCNNDILNYAIPPFAGILTEIFDISDYKALKLTKTELENYAVLVMTLGINDDGEWLMDYDKAVDFWQNLDGVLPEEVGSVLSPMPINKISFEKTHVSDSNTVADAEQNLFSAAGVSSLLFANDKASANALQLSIKADQSITYNIVKSLEDVVNRYIQSQSYGKNFKVTFLDVSPYNRKEVGDAYLKAATYGMPMVSYYCASQGLSQAELDGMNFLENDVLGIKDLFIPLQSSATQSGKSDGGSSEPLDEGGRPESEIGDLTEAGEATREDQ